MPLSAVQREQKHCQAVATIVAHRISQVLYLPSRISTRLHIFAEYLIHNRPPYLRHRFEPEEARQLRSYPRCQSHLPHWQQSTRLMGRPRSLWFKPLLILPFGAGLARRRTKSHPRLGTWVTLLSLNIAATEAERTFRQSKMASDFSRL